MQITWEESDIWVGRRFYHKTPDTETWMIGYDARTREDDTDRYCIISMEDGMICHFCNSKVQIAEFLNKSNYIPCEILNRKT